jgi:Uma2 family endonuclease
MTMLECDAKELPMSESAHLVTAEELERFPSDDNRYELVAGRLVPMTPVSFAHGRTVIQFGALLHEYIRKRKLGVVVTEVGFILAIDPDTVRAPDLAFLRQERIPTPDPRGFWPGAPDLAVEVLSPDDRAGEIRSKVDEYFARGVHVVLVIDPDPRSVEVHRPSRAPITLAETDTLDLGDVLPGFRCSVAEIFE